MKQIGTRMPSIAFFDFDDTITKGDSLWYFLLHSFSPLHLALKFISISPSLVLFKLKLMSNEKAKSKLFKAFFSSMTTEEFDALAKSYANSKLTTIIKQEALARIKWHQQKGHDVVVVSASPENWLRPWCNNQGIQLIGTQLESKDGKITGNFVGKNCYGEEKKQRILSHYQLKDYDSVYAYGDSRGDKEMLALADHSFYRTFE